MVGVVVVLGVLGKLPFQSKPSPASKGSGLVTTFQPGEFRSVPNACGMVSSATISQYLPGKVARVSQDLGSSTQSQCYWTLDAKPDFRVLSVTGEAFSPSLLASGDGSATFSAIDAYGTELQNLQHPAKKTKAPQAQIGVAVGLGTTAFTALQVFHQGGGDITDEVTVVVRDHNALIIVTMQGQEHGHGFGPVPDATLRAGAPRARTASGEKSAVLADPLRWPKYTVIPMLRSRWCSSVSTSPSRTPTERPVSWLTAASAWEAPRARASSRARSIIDSRSGAARRNGLLGTTAIVISNLSLRGLQIMILPT